MEDIIGKIFITNSGDKFKVLNKSEKQYYYNIEFLVTKFLILYYYLIFFLLK